jgi:hypothetical protein
MKKCYKESRGRGVSYVVQTTKRRKASWICHILFRNCLLKRCIEGKVEGRIEVTGRRGRRRRQLLDDLKDKRGY